jgi:hypothetical protein
MPAPTPPPIKDDSFRWPFFVIQRLAGAKWAMVAAMVGSKVGVGKCNFMGKI